MSALTLTHRFGAFELPSYDRRNEGQPRKPYAAAVLISDLIPSAEIQISSPVRYRMNAEEHDILFSALKASVEIRATLPRQ
jgi:hypothetical protein